MRRILIKANCSCGKVINTGHDTRDSSVIVEAFRVLGTESATHSGSCAGSIAIEAHILQGVVMNFGGALEALKAGKMVRRRGWNGKGMHLYLEDSFMMPVRGGAHEGAIRIYEPVICMFTAQQKHQPGWLASQADMLAEDWELVDE